MSMAEYVADVYKGDQQPYGEKDKETNPQSRRWRVNFTILCKISTKLVMSRV